MIQLIKKSEGRGFLLARIFSLYSPVLQSRCQTTGRKNFQENFNRFFIAQLVK